MLHSDYIIKLADYYCTSVKVIKAACALGNLYLAIDTDEEELPDTDVQRFLRSFGACLTVRGLVGGHSVSSPLVDELAHCYGLSWFEGGDLPAWLPDDGQMAHLRNFFNAWVASGETLDYESWNATVWDQT